MHARAHTIMLQAKHIIQAITPDEYDAAVRHSPYSGPLAALGDRRTGRQLLADGAADWRRSFGSMAATAQGRAEMDALAAAVERLGI